MRNIKTNLIHITPPEGVLAAIGKPYRTETPSIDLVKRICLAGEGLNEHHGSVLEHIVMTWDILGSSRCELQEHMRHRLASPTVESTRFALKKIFSRAEFDADDINSFFVMPDRELLADRFPKMTEDQWSVFYEEYRKTVLQSVASMKRLIDLGVPNDLAKYNIVEGLRVNFTWTINMRSLLNFLRLRHAGTAHFEIHHIAGLMIEELKKTWAWELLEGRI